MGRATAYGKAILAGEHFVVYGTAAVALPVPSRGVTVTADRAPGSWSVPSEVDAHLRRCLERLGEAPPELTISVESTLPIGSGLGGSAAFAVALVRALADQGIEDREVRRRAHELERLAHGSPSGIDDAVATFACPVFLTPLRSVEPLQLSEMPRIWIAVSDQRSSTLEAVEQVRTLKERDEANFARLRARAAQVVARAHAALIGSDWEALGLAMRENQQLLVEVGVSTPALDRLVSAAEAGGALGAKLTGAGLGGAVVALAPEGVDLQDALLSAGAQEVIAP